MKTIVETATSLSKYLLEDDVALEVNSDHIVVGDPTQFIIGDLNSGNVTLTENVADAPTDWIGNKYFFDGATWTLNPAWVDPEAEG